MYLTQEEVYAAILLAVLLIIMLAVIIKGIRKELMCMNSKLRWIENYLMELRRENNESNSSLH